MEGSYFPVYGPSWNKTKNRHAFQYQYLRKYPTPDGMNCGPVVNTFSKDVTTNGEKYSEVKVYQDPCMKFPFTCITPFLQPLQPNVVSIHSPFTPNDSRNYYSNKLSSFTSCDSHHLIFGEASGTSHFVKVAKIKKRDPSKKAYLKLGKKRNLIQYDHFHQADSAVVGGIPSALLRIDDTINFISIEEKSFSLHSIPGNKCVDCRLSRSLNNNFAFANDDGSVYIYDIIKNKSSWGGKFVDSVDKNWFGCEFGCHPLQMNVACASGVWVIDSRCALRGENNSRQIFDIKEMKDYIDENNEVICSFKNIPGHPLVHVICSETVFLMDTRHCRHPVLTWHHMINGQPCFPNILKNGQDTDALLMAEPKHFQMCVIPYRWSQGTSSPHIQAISTPRHFNVAADTLSFARLNDSLFTENINSHFKSYMAGLSVSPSLDKKETLVYFQNQFGNLFYSKLVDRKVKESYPRPRNDVLGLWEEFEKELGVHSRPNPHHTYTKVTYIEGLKKKPKSDYVSKYNSLVRVPSCKGYTWNLSDIYQYRPESKKIFDIDIDNDVIDRITADNSPINFFHKKHHEDLQLSSLREYSASDPLSKTLLSVWEEDNKVNPEDEKGNNTFVYRRFPLNVDKNTRIEVPNYMQYDEAVETDKAKSDEVSLHKEQSTPPSNSQNDVSGYQAVPAVQKGVKRRKSRVSGF